jgi:uncharacterized protein DUF4125
MAETTEERAKLLAGIIDAEWDMFTRTRSREPSACQQQPGTFRLMRWMSHSVLGDDLLRSYLEDLETAQRVGRNFMIEKYAIMEGQIQPDSNDWRIEDIVMVEDLWMRELGQAYPLTFPGDTGMFKRYLGAELRTLSDRTLTLYHRLILRARSERRNLDEERYANLFRRMGYQRIADRESANREEQRACADSRSTRIADTSQRSSHHVQ